jgi:hypothetical protein
VIQLWNAAIAVDGTGAAGDGGMGAAVFCIRWRDTCASVNDVLAGSAIVKLAYVRSERGAPPASELP